MHQRGGVSLSNSFSRPLRRERIETFYTPTYGGLPMVSPGLCVGSGLKRRSSPRISTRPVFLPASASGAD